jgi:hypothetical protein
MEEVRAVERRRSRWAALDAAEGRLQQSPVALGRVHAQQLRDVLVVAEGYSAQGLSLSVAPQIGLLLRCSGAKAERLLTEACTWAGLPQALAAVEAGVLTVEQSAVAAVELSRVPDLPTRLVVWRLLLERLRADAEAGAVLPPPRRSARPGRWRC